MARGRTTRMDAQAGARSWLSTPGPQTPPGQRAEHPPPLPLPRWAPNAIPHRPPVTSTAIAGVLSAPAVVTTRVTLTRAITGRTAVLDGAGRNSFSVATPP